MSNKKFDLDIEKAVKLAQQFANAVKTKYNFIKIILFALMQKGISMKIVTLILLLFLKTMVI